MNTQNASPAFSKSDLTPPLPVGCPGRWLVILAAAVLLSGTVLAARAARPWPDTRFRIVPFVDQLPATLTETQRWFAATRLAGTQKMLRSEIRALRVYNTNFLCLHYQLGIGCGAHSFVRGDEWITDWPLVNAQTNWFLLNASGQRVHQNAWDWDVMNILYSGGLPVTGFPQYWISNCLDRIVASEDDGVFADSFTPDAYGFGGCNPTHPWLEDPDLCMANWVPALEQFGRAAKRTLHDTNGYLFLPNLGAMVTGWLDMDYGLGDGGMIEGFAFFGPGSYFDPADWQLQMNRALTLVRSNKVVLCQSYPEAGNATERMFATASYLLVKGGATYLNLLSTDEVALEYYPEYTLDLGGAKGATPADTDSLWNATWSVYRRDYTNGIVLVNPGATSVNIPSLGAQYWRVSASGGGVVSSSGNYGGSIALSATTSLTLPACSGAVLMFTNSTGTNVTALQPTNFHALHRSGQTFLTWTERADLTGESYRIYRHTQPITSGNLSSATRLYEVWEDSSRFYANWHYSDPPGAFAPRYLDRLVISNRAAPLSSGTGLLAWTLATNDFAGGATGSVYYAVTTVTSDGAENTTTFNAGNTLGPVSEGVAEPLPVEAAVSVGDRGHLYIQYMDLRQWNPTFHAPNAANAYYGFDSSVPAIQHALAYAYDYVIFEPECTNSVLSPAVFSLHGWSGNTYGPVTTDPDPWGWCTYKIYPIDQGETWWFGFARSNDYRISTTVSAPDTIVNYTEQRLLRMIRGLQRNPPAATLDTNRVYVYGQSMGGSGTLSLAMRYPNVFAAANASEPMTDYSTSGDGGGTDWRGDAAVKWGEPAFNLPVSLDGPAGWADHLKRYNGTGVWAWENHRINLTSRIGDDTVPFSLGHGTNDTIIEWATQGRPVYAALEASRRCWGGLISEADHVWLGFFEAPPTLGPNSSSGTPFQTFSFVRNETVPGFSRVSGSMPFPPTHTGTYNPAIAWSASWDSWDGAPVDTATNWQISLRTIDATSHTADITPRRAQQFHLASGNVVRWRYFRVSDGAELLSGTVTADASALVTVSNLVVTPDGNRLRLELQTPPRITNARREGTGFRVTFTTMSGKQYRVQHSRSLSPTNWSTLSASLSGTGVEAAYTHTNAMTNTTGFYRILQLP